MTSPSGVQVAPGDPGALYAAAQWHQDLSNTLYTHGHTVAGAASSVGDTWVGEAATSYQALSAIVAAHFWTASGLSASAASTLYRYATDLARLQLEGVNAVRQAEHWLGEVHTWTGKLNAANTAVTRARTDLQTAQRALQTAATSPHGSAVAAAATAVRTAQGALTRAEGDQRHANTELTRAQDQLTHWQRVGARLWNEARDAAVRATGELEPLDIPAPPLAGPASDTPFAPPTAPLDPAYQLLLKWLQTHPNSAVTDPDPRHHEHGCKPYQMYLPYFGCKDSPPKFKPPPPPPPAGPAPGCAGGIQIPLLGCVQPPSLPDPPPLPHLPGLPPLPPLPIPA